MHEGSKPRHPGEELDQLENDFQRYQLCRARAEDARDKYFVGRMESIARDGEVAGRVKWSTSPLAKDLVTLQQMYERWALFYLSAATAAQQLGAGGAFGVADWPRFLPCETCGAPRRMPCRSGTPGSVMWQPHDGRRKSAQFEAGRLSF